MCLAIPGKIVELAADEPHLALVEVGGVRRRVDIDLLREDGTSPRPRLGMGDER